MKAEAEAEAELRIRRENEVARMNPHRYFNIFIIFFFEKLSQSTHPPFDGGNQHFYIYIHSA